MIGYQIPISLSPPEDCFGEHLEAGWLKGLHSYASVSAFRGTDTRPLPGKEAEPALGGVGWTKRKLELESMRASYFSLLQVPAGRAGRSAGGGWGSSGVINTQAALIQSFSPRKARFVAAVDCGKYSVGAAEGVYS